MIKAMFRSWAFWCLYAYEIGPAIDKAIPESNNGCLKTVKVINQLYTAVNKLCFITPIMMVKAVVEMIEDK